MRYVRDILIVPVFALFISLQLSCKKYLDLKPDKTQVVPDSLDDLQRLLDFNDYVNSLGPQMLELIADNYYLLTATWSGRAENERLNYIWDANAIDNNSWINTYQKPINYANVVLDQLHEIKFDKNDEERYRNIKGMALFIRSFYFYELAQLYCKPYAATANADPGIVLRLKSSIEEKSVRSTVQQTYDQIIGDLKATVELLPETVVFPTRPNKAAALGALARVYLSMRDYDNALRFADSCLKKYNALMDYNALLPVKNPPFSRFNKEIVFYSMTSLPGSLINSRARIDSTLYQSYHANDLRKTIFFQTNTDGTVGFRGSYEGSPGSAASIVFDGITTDEMYLIRAECYARSNNKNLAMADLNTLMQNRWSINHWSPFTAVDAADALNKILTERRKELLYRGLRWTDLRRLNIEGANITLTRIINNTTYTLPPMDPRWVLLIPSQIINATGMPQNPRQ